MRLCPSVPAALIASVLQGGTYVACLYVRADFRRPGGRAPNRDDPRVVKQRFVRVGIASVIAPCIALLASSLPGGREECAAKASIARWFGLWAPSAALGAALPLILTMVLFLGPLLLAWLERDRFTPLLGQMRQWWPAEEHGRMLLMRNLLIGPLSEEWVFRACMCSLLFGAGLSDVVNVFVSATIFGLAHVHHIFDSDVHWLSVFIQFTYTTLFGAYSSYLFLRTGHLLGPLLAHMFCNSQGLPAFGRVPGHEHERLLAAAFVLGLASFTLLVTLDAIYRPLLFHSIFWREDASCWESWR